MDAGLLIMLVHTVGVRRLDTVAAYTADGAPIYQAAVEVRAFVERKRMRDSHPDGTFALKTATVVITEVEVSKDDLVFLHGVDRTNTDLGKSPTDVVVHYEPDRRDGSGNPIVSHYEVVL